MPENKGVGSNSGWDAATMAPDKDKTVAPMSNKRFGPNAKSEDSFKEATQAPNKETRGATAWAEHNIPTREDFGHAATMTPVDEKDANKVETIRPIPWPPAFKKV